MHMNPLEHRFHLRDLEREARREVERGPARPWRVAARLGTVALPLAALILLAL